MTHTIEEGNEIIRKFLEWEKVVNEDKKGCDIVYWKIGNNWPHASGKLKFHTSWDWLMPVVEKIESLGNYGVEIRHFSCSIYELSFDPSDLNIESNFDSKIEAVYNAVVQFIQWYNQNKTTQP